MFNPSESPCEKLYEESSNFSPTALTVDFSVESSPFNNGFHHHSGRQTAIDTGYSDDSDLPRLSPIRTSSESALNNLKKPTRRVIKPEMMSVPSPIDIQQRSANSSPGWKWHPNGWNHLRKSSSHKSSSTLINTNFNRHHNHLPPNQHHLTTPNQHHLTTPNQHHLPQHYQHHLPQHYQHLPTPNQQIIQSVNGMMIMMSDTDEEHMSEWSCCEPESNRSTSTMATYPENVSNVGSSVLQKVSQEGRYVGEIMTYEPISDKALDDQTDRISSGFGNVIGSIFGNKASNLCATIANFSTKTSKIKRSIKKQDINSYIWINHSDLKTPKSTSSSSERMYETIQDHTECSKTTLPCSSSSKPYSSIVNVDIPESMSFDEYFCTYNGHIIFEQLETLCNECSKDINRTRAQLSDDGKEAYDKTICQLISIFDLEELPPSENEDGGCQLKYVDKDMFQQYNDSISTLVASMREEADAMDKAAIEDISYIVINPINMTSACCTPGSIKEEYIDLKMDLDEAVFIGRNALQRIHEEGLRRIAKLCVCCLQCLLRISEKINLQRNKCTKKTSDKDDILLLNKDCTNDENAFLKHLFNINIHSREDLVLSLLRPLVIQLIHDVQSVTEAFLEALLNVGNCYDENLKDFSCGHKAAGLASDMEVDSSTAVTKIQETFRNMMFLVISSTFASTDDLVHHA